MNEEIKFSVVIPIYNVEKYLNRCLDSVINQTYKNLEIILIDDGSNDSSPNICEYYKEKDDRIKVIHKANQGLGMARNTGIDAATGDYICFFDSDDFVDLSLFSECYKYLSKKTYDILCYDYSLFKNGKIIKLKNKNKIQEYFNDDVINKCLNFMICDEFENKRISDSAWSKIYSLQLIRKTNFKFVSEREYISEDFYSHLILFKDVKSVLILPDALYYYCSNPNSLTNSYREDRLKKRIYQYNKSVELVELYHYPSTFNEALAIQFFSTFLGIFKLIFNNTSLNNEGKKEKIFEIFENQELLKILQKIKYKNIKLTKKILLRNIVKKRKNIAYLILKIKYSK